MNVASLVITDAVRNSLRLCCLFITHYSCDIINVDVAGVFNSKGTANELPWIAALQDLLISLLAHDCAGTVCSLDQHVDYLTTCSVSWVLVDSPKSHLCGESTVL